MAIQARLLHKKIKKEISKYNIDINDVYFYSPNKTKSFQVASWIYAKINNIGPEQFYNQEYTYLPKNAKRVVILDDFSGTGESLYEEIIAVIRHGQDEDKIITASFYATKRAQKFFKEVDETFISATLDHSDLPKNAKLRRFGQGFQTTNSTFSMEYMSPDNNNAFFISYLAPLFTLIKRSIKNFK